MAKQIEPQQDEDYISSYNHLNKQWIYVRNPAAMGALPYRPEAVYVLDSDAEPIDTPKVSRVRDVLKQGFRAGFNSSAAVMELDTFEFLAWLDTAALSELDRFVEWGTNLDRSKWV